MSKFKLGDLIRPKKNPTYLPEEVRIVTELHNRENLLYDMTVDDPNTGGVEYTGVIERSDDWQPAYPVPILIGDTVKVKKDVTVEEIAAYLAEPNGGKTVLKLMREAAGQPLLVGDRSPKEAFVANEDRTVHGWYPLGMFDLVKRGEPVPMSLREIEELHFRRIKFIDWEDD